MYNLLFGVLLIISIYIIILILLLIHSYGSILRHISLTTSVLSLSITIIAHMTEFGLIPNIHNYYPIICICLVVLGFSYIKYYCWQHKYTNMFSLIIWCKRLLVTEKYLLLLCILAIITYLFQATLIYPNSVDEMTYHIPQAISILKTGQMRSLSLPWAPWVYYYPQGVPALWAWGLSLTRSVSILPWIDLLYIFQLISSVAYLAQELKIPRLYIFLLICIIITMPMMYVLTTIRNADLANAAAILSIYAVGISGNRTDSNFTEKSFLRNILHCTIFYTQACLFKVPIFSSVAFICSIILILYNYRSMLPNLNVRLIATTALYCVLFLTQAFISNIIAFKDHGNPFYPFDVNFGGLQLLDGPIKSDLFLRHVQSHYGGLVELPFATRWVAVIGDWLRMDWDLNSAGLGGPTFVYVIVFLVLLAVLDAVAQNNWLVMYYFTINIYVILFSTSPMLRYVFANLIVIIVIGLWGASRLVSNHTRFVQACSILCIISTLSPILQIARTLIWTNSMIYPNSLVRDGGYTMAEKITLHEEFSPSSHIMRGLRSNWKDTDTVVFSIETYPLLLWTKKFENNIYYEAIPQSDEDNEHIEQFLSRVCSHKPRYFLVKQNMYLNNYIVNYEGECQWRLITSDNSTTMDKYKTRSMNLYKIHE